MRLRSDGLLHGEGHHHLYVFVRDVKNRSGEAVGVLPHFRDFFVAGE